MSENMEPKVVIGQELPKEKWLEAASNIHQVAIPVANFLLKLNHDGLGQQDAEHFMLDIQLALMAMKYVAAFATDKCRFIVVDDGSIGFSQLKEDKQ